MSEDGGPQNDVILKCSARYFTQKCFGQLAGLEWSYSPDWICECFQIQTCTDPKKQKQLICTYYFISEYVQSTSKISKYFTIHPHMLMA